MASRKVNVTKKVVHFGIPSSRIFLNTIKRFLKVKNKARVILDIAKRLFHVYFFLQIPMQEDRFNIHLMKMEFILAMRENVSL
jgi:hypothetical protein